MMSTMNAWLGEDQIKMDKESVGSWVHATASSPSIGDSTFRGDGSEMMEEISSQDDFAGRCGKTPGTKGARQNHSEIERRRRDKMNAYIKDLSKVVPLCNAMNRKLDKLTVLRMTVQHMKNLRGAGASPAEAVPKSPYLPEEQLKHLILTAAQGFLFVMSCDRGRILYVSTSVQEHLNYSQSELIGQSLFDLLHPKDLTKVKEQLLSSDLSPRERFIDSKTMMPVQSKLLHNAKPKAQFNSGARRSFMCHIRKANPVKPEMDEMGANSRRKRTERRHYSTVHCTGYIKSWEPSKMSASSVEEDPGAEEAGDSCNLNCLVAMGLLMPTDPDITASSAAPAENALNVRPLDFTSRHMVDGKFMQVDPRCTSVLGYLPQELLGTSIYEYYHQEDIDMLSQIHKKILRTCNEKIETPPYRFKMKNGRFLQLQTKSFSFRNPWTKELEYLICTHTILPESVTSSMISAHHQHTPTPPVELAPQDIMPTTAQLLELGERSGVGLSKKQFLVPSVPTRPGIARIGRKIVEEHTREESCSVPVDSLSVHAAAAFPSHQPFGNPLPSGGGGGGGGAGSMEPEQGYFSTTTDSSSGTEGNDDAAMAMIMSLLEADAGLGGPVDFNNMPWPL